MAVNTIAVAAQQNMRRVLLAKNQDAASSVLSVRFCFLRRDPISLTSRGAAR